MAYHPGVGVVSLATGAPTFLNHIYLSTFCDKCRDFPLDLFFASNYNLLLEHLFEMRRNPERGVELMTRNEYELMYLIRTNDNPQKAVMTAIDIICQYITQHGSSQAQLAADQPESA